MMNGETAWMYKIACVFVFQVNQLNYLPYPEPGSSDLSSGRMSLAE